jgi:hypothetical protein
MMGKAFLVFLTACNLPAEPALLDHAQILAVRVEPPTVPPGQRAKIDVLAGNTAGDVFVVAPDALDAGGAPIAREADGWYITAGDGPGALLTATVGVDGDALVADKLVAFGDRADNPTIAAIQLDGTDATALACSTGTKPALAANADGVAPLAFAWYSSVGKLEHYRSVPATLDADAPAEGVVVLVVRDARGGVDWNVVPAVVTN